MPTWLLGFGLVWEDLEISVWIWFGLAELADLSLDLGYFHNPYSEIRTIIYTQINIVVIWLEVLLRMRNTRAVLSIKQQTQLRTLYKVARTN